MNSNRFLCLFLLISISIFFIFSCRKAETPRKPLSRAATFAGLNREFGEPFGLALHPASGSLYVSDGEKGSIFRVLADGKTELVTDKLDTPSQIAFDKDGFLIVADAGSHSIRRVDAGNGNVETIAGIDGKKGSQDGEARQALFNAPVGVAVFENKIFVADTYNDKIRIVENGRVSTLAGTSQGFADGSANQAKFDTPCGIAVLRNGNLIVADTGNRRIREIDAAGGNVSTFAGTGEADLTDGFPAHAKFVEPSAVAVDEFGVVYVADGNAIRAVNRGLFPMLPLVETISGTKRGFSDGAQLRESRFNRPSGLAIDKNGNLFVADAENQTVRVLTGETTGREASREEIEKLRYTAREFRALQPPRWTYNPPDAQRDISGTIGEIRGEIPSRDGRGVWFHNGLDIAGGYGETARFIRAEKVLQPTAAENFGNLRELLRMPTIGYVHIRLGRDAAEKPFGDERFQFSRDEASGKIIDVRVPRGARFQAGEAIGTLNAFNHVHLIAGRSGAEMNALDALEFPNLSDNIAPVIEKVTLTDENWQAFETRNANQRIKLNGKTRIVVRSFDQMDGGAARRRLGVFRLGYQILRGEDKTPATGEKTTISFARMPDEDFVSLVYAPGSQSGYTPVTIFDYVVSNEIDGDAARENFIDAANLEAGNYILRVFAADFFGNKTERDLSIEIIK
jgi:DNA-binding beta-propeller fold protein YncE